MNRSLKPVFALLLLSLLATSSIQADSGEKIIIALKTDDFELAQTDVSTLAVGESQTIETDSGRVIDILRTTDGVEIYVDGELLDVGSSSNGLHEDHMIKEQVEVNCDDDDEECDKNIYVIVSDDTDSASWVTENNGDIIVKKEIELSCTDEAEGTTCSSTTTWVSDGEDIDPGKLHEMHMQGEGEGQQVIMIKKHVVTEN